MINSLDSNMFIEVPASKKSLSKRKLVHGVGINDSKYLTRYKGIDGKLILCPHYNTWKSMITRCYSDACHSKRPTYSGCMVCDDWLIFSKFKAWMKDQIWEGMSLDKDLLNHGNKTYSPDNCMFVNQETNNLLTDTGSRRGEHPIGVSFISTEGRFRSSCMANGKLKNLGRYDTEKEAHKVYCEFKSSHVRGLAEECKEAPNDPRLYGALLINADRIEAMADL